MNPRNQFTLIEMLVVVAIIGILAALLAPALHKALNSSRTVSCANNLKQINIATLQYADDNNGFLPPLQSPANLKFEMILAPYFSYDVNYLISIRQRSSRPNNPSLAYFCPANSYSGQYSPTNYTINSKRFVDWLNTSEPLKKLSRSGSPSKTLTQTDLRDRRLYGYSEGAAMNAPGHIDPTSIYCVVEYLTHLQRANFLLLDGHTQSVGEAEALGMPIEF